ncbi:hypothetical protein F5050DRAFT_972387 [Lentinula boryana]|uniref:Uncharacterized protein n=1 Tax=Lentinula boryana TaxID=40481 RepID=A0ABQ8Q169_9AGAR|nr:hypothetical protein F5050DRAFT_972387 [Lentinula boryana]
MLFTVSTSRLFTLLYLCVSILTASGSPLPPDGVISSRPELPPGSRFKSEVQLELGYDKLKQTSTVHAVLTIDDTTVHATWTDNSYTQLHPEEISEIRLKHFRSDFAWIPLGEAKFKSPADKEQALKDILSIKLPPYTETGGSCWNYIESALKTLTKREELLDSASVLEKFTESKGQHGQGS